MIGVDTGLRPIARPRSQTGTDHDRFRLMTFPLMLGSGQRLFSDGTVPATMRPVHLATTELGTVIGTYEPAGPVRVGHI